MTICLILCDFVQFYEALRDFVGIGRIHMREFVGHYRISCDSVGFSSILLDLWDCVEFHRTLQGLYGNLWDAMRLYGMLRTLWDFMRFNVIFRVYVGFCGILRDSTCLYFIYFRSFYGILWDPVGWTVGVYESAYDICIRCLYAYDITLFYGIMWEFARLFIEFHEILCIYRIQCNL